MPAVLTHKSIMLLARERVRQLRDALDAKIRDNLQVTDFDRRMQFLAQQTYDIMSFGPHPTVDPLVYPFRAPLEEVSIYAVMGSMGPDITGFSALFAPGQAWVFDTVHKGYPDENREAVVARTTDFVFSFYRLVSAKIIGNYKGSEQQNWLKRMQAYVLGHLCHIAGDVISHPFINEIEWQLGLGSRQKFSHSGGEGSIDAQVARQVLMRSSIREGQSREGQRWEAWWPRPSDVPPEFYDAYAEALEQTYRSMTSRRTGYREFEDELTALDPPLLTADFVRDGYQVYRQAILHHGYGKGAWGWAGFLSGLFIPLLLLFPATLIPEASRRFSIPRSQDPGAPMLPDVDEQSWMQVFAVPLMIISPAVFAYTAYFASLTTLGVTGHVVLALLALGIMTVLGFIFFLTAVGAIDSSGWPSWLRWLLFVVIPGALGVVFFFYWLIHEFLGGDKKRRRRGILSLLVAVPAAVAIVFALFFALGIAIVASKTAQDSAGRPVAFAITTAIWIVIGIILWSWASHKARDGQVPENPDPYPAQEAHLVRVFDDAALFHDPGAVAPPDVRDDRFLPSARRKLLHLWWSGDGDLYVRSDRQSLTFSFSGNAGDAQNQTVPAPLSPMTATEYAHYLGRTVHDSAGHTDLLKASRPFPSDPDYELPLGQVFADNGDAEDKLVDHDKKAADFVKLDKAADGTGSFLYHAPKPVQSVRFGRQGPELTPADVIQSNGTGTISSLGTVVTGTGTQFATDLVVGDAIRCDGQTRDVTAVSSATQLTIDAPFSLDVTNLSFERLRRPTTAGTGTISAAAAGTTVTQAGGSDFDTFFVAGDLLRTTGANPVVRRVVRVTSPTTLDVDQPFTAALAAVGFEKLARLEGDDGYLYVARPGDEQAGSGDTLMDYAADFGALLCLGATSQVIDDGARPNIGGAPLRKAYQVFRNWNLDRRRINEWRMLVAGGAVSEKHGHPESMDPANDTAVMRPTETWNELVPAGERVANTVGWVPLFRRLLDVARRPTVNAASDTALHPGDPPVRDLSRAIAFLMGMPDVT